MTLRRLLAIVVFAGGGTFLFFWILWQEASKYIPGGTG